jgi:hypothetical protein
MRIVILGALALLVSNSIVDRAAADPYRWCADYGIGSDAGTNCYFMTLEQCRASASGVGGFCRPNGFYDGQPVTSPGAATSRSGKRSFR